MEAEIISKISNRMNPMEQPVPSERKVSGLEQKKAEHQSELEGVEAKLGEIEQLEKIRSGMGSVQEVLKGIGGTDDAAEKLAAFMDSVSDTITEKGVEDLLARRRELRQRIVQAGIDLGEQQ